MAHRNTGGRIAPTSSAVPSPRDRSGSDPKHPALTVCVFCGSSPGNDSAYAEAARKLGRLIGEGGHRLVFGAGNIGLMGEVARAARDSGAEVIGILPSFLRHLEPPLKSAEELIVTPDLQQRKSRMLAMSDAFILLPGGLGTMDEYFEVVTTAQLSVHHKPIVMLDVKNYFKPLKALMAHIVEQGFARDGVTALQTFVDTPEEAMRIVSSRPVSA